MKETARIADQMKRAFEGNAWHGPALRELLATVSAEDARQRLLAGRHTIWEIVLHIAAWKRVVVHRLKGETMKQPPEGDWPQVGPTTSDAWQTVLRDLEASQQRLLAAVSAFPDSRLEDQVQGSEGSFYLLLHGIVQHDLYHAGQIALLRQKP
jgi:uncharacterized damage-inducible protein DinB